MSTLRHILKPTLFTAGVFGTCFCTVAILEHENRKNKYHYVKQWMDSANKRRFDTNQKLLKIRQRVNEWKNNLTTGEKLAAGTIFINAMVLGGWRIQSLRPMMNRFFLCHTSPKVALSPMILSCFSHAMPLHFALNMYVAYSFSNIATSLLGPEQLIGVFLAAGTFSSLTSIGLKLLRGVNQPSLGASGALLGVIAYICTVRPNTELLLFFVPVEAGNAIKLLMAVDVLGILLRWRYLDHAAHLGGAAFGIWYGKYGEEFYHKYKSRVIKNWIDFKSSNRTRSE